MKATIVMVILTLIWVVTPTVSDAKDRDRHDQAYGKERNHSVYQQERGHDHDRNRDARHGKSWKKQHRHENYWNNNHRPKRHVAYRPAVQRVLYRPIAPRVVYRQPAVIFPAPSLYIGVPNLSFRVTW